MLHWLFTFKDLKCSKWAHLFFLNDLFGPKTNFKCHYEANQPKFSPKNDITCDVPMLTNNKRHLLCCLHLLSLVIC